MNIMWIICTPFLYYGGYVKSWKYDQTKEIPNELTFLEAIIFTHEFTHLIQLRNQWEI